MKCPSCGQTLEDDAKFCSHCGNSTQPSERIPPNVEPEIDGEKGRAGNFYMAPPPDETQERVLWNEYPSMKTAIPWIILWLFLGAAIILVLQIMPVPWGGTAQLVVSAVVVVLALVLVARHFIRLHAIRYRLSSQRIFVTHGILNKRTDEVELEKYKDIFVNQDFWDKIVGCGDIEIITSDTTNPTIQIIDVGDPIGKKEDIRAAARERKSSLGIARREEL